MIHEYKNNGKLKGDDQNEIENLTILGLGGVRVRYVGRLGLGRLVGWTVGVGGVALKIHALQQLTCNQYKYSCWCIILKFC